MAGPSAGQRVEDRSGGRRDPSDRLLPWSIQGCASWHHWDAPQAVRATMKPTRLGNEAGFAAKRRRAVAFTLTRGPW